LKHPLKELTQPILGDIATIEKMKKAKRYPVPEKLLHLPNKGRTPFILNIDSIMHSAYNDEEIDLWAEYQPEVDAPANSQESFEQYNFYSSDEDSLFGEIFSGER
jgi:hypothetical protein